MKNYTPLLLFLILVAPLANAAHASFDMGELVNTVNQNTDAVSPELMQIFGNERINVYLEDGALGFVTKNGKITEYYTTEVQNPTLKVYLDSKTLTQLINGQLDINTALNEGKIRYEAIDAVTKIKMIIAEIARSLFSALLG